MSDLDQLVAGVRSAVSETRWPDAARLRAVGDRRRARRRVATVAGAVAAVVAVGAALAFGPTGRHPQPPVGTPTPAPASTTATSSVTASPAPTTAAATLSILRQGSVEHGAEPRSMAVGHGSVWLAFAAPPIRSAGDSPGPGELVRLDQQTLKVTARWSIAGSPEGLVVTDRYVWVLGTAFDNRPAAQNANHVQQFDLGGTLLHSYAIVDPTLLAPQGDSVWVEFGAPSTPAYLTRLHDGIADIGLQLGGTNTLHPVQGGGLVACPDGIYAASADEGARATVVDRIVGGQNAARVRLPVLGLTALGCGQRQGVIAVTPDPSGTTLQPLFVGGQDLGKSTDLAGFGRALGFSAAGVWMGLSGEGGGAGTRVWLVDGGSPGKDTSLPGDVPFAVADDQALWTVGPDSRNPTTSWTVTAIGAS